MILIGYSGHAFVVYGIFKAAGISVTGYCDKIERAYNPFLLYYFGPEESEYAQQALHEKGCFIAIGDNDIRSNIYSMLSLKDIQIKNAIHPLANIDYSSEIAEQAVMVGAGVTINPLTKIGTGVICNTGCIIEHENIINNFAHIGPGAVLCGNVVIGEKTFIGANAVVKQGIIIGKGVIIGAGAVVLKDVPDHSLVIGNPGKPY